MNPKIKTAVLPNKVALPYFEQGNTKGVPTLLLHGYIDSWRSFELVLPYLPKSIRAISLTQRGHGDASRPPAGYHPRDFAADLIAFMDTLGLEEAVLVGGSSGGLVARYAAIDHPDRVLGLVFLGTPGVLKDKPGARQLWESCISTLTDPVDPSFVREFQESTVALPVPKEFFETLVEESLKVPARVWRDTFQGLLEDNSFDFLERIKVPSLILWGDQDRFLPKEDQEAFAAKITDSTLVVYPGAGHGLQWEKPEDVSREIAAFVEYLTK